MYESKTYDSIMQDLLSHVTGNISKEEGSIIYSALSPVAYELEKDYIQMDVIIKESFADTQSYEYLKKRAAERGIYPEGATYCKAKGVFNCAIPLGTRFSIDIYNYKVTSLIDNFSYILTCETSGAGPNTIMGVLTQIDYVNGLESADLVEILIAGKDEEEVETFRKRYLNSFDSVAFGGNIEDYKEKVLALDGIGGVKVHPVWNGGGTVKIVIIGADYGVPSTTLVSTTQTAVCPEPYKGYGIAPIGHDTTVVAASAADIAITTIITYSNGYTFELLKSEISSVINTYLLELKKTWQDLGDEGIVIRVSQIESRILDITGIKDIQDTFINGTSGNTTLNADEIPVLSGVIA